MSFTPEVILNFVVLAVLAIMIVYCVVLNRRLKAFNNIKQELADIINQLNASTSHAQNSIVEFKNVVSKEEKRLSKTLRKASEMADELDMINQTGSNLADRIEKGLTGNQKPETHEKLSVVREEKSVGEKISLSDLDNEESSADNAEGLRESIRNIR